MFANQNTFTGGVTLNQGQLTVQDLLGLGGANGTTPGTVTLNGGTLALNSNGGGPNGTLIYGNQSSSGISVVVNGYATINVDRVGANTGNQIQVGTLSMANNTLTLTGANSYSLRVAGNTTLGGAYANFNTTTGGPTFLDLAGVISGAGALNKFGGATTTYGTLRISGTANIYDGGTNIQVGALQVTATSGTPLGQGAVNVLPSAALRIANNGSIGGISSLNLFSNISSLPAIVLDTDYVVGTGLNSSTISMYGGFGAALQISVPEFSSAINLANVGNGRLFLGSYGGTEVQYLAPTLGVGADDTYRLGGNTGGSLSFVGVNNVLTGSARVIIGSQLGNLQGSAITNGGGTVIIRNSNDFSGGTTISKGSILSIDTGAINMTPLGDGDVGDEVAFCEIPIQLVTHRR